MLNETGAEDTHMHDVHACSSTDPMLIPWVPWAASPDRLMGVVALADRLVVLTADGRLYERLPDPRSFASGPHHLPGYLWRRIQGPLDGGE